jgi:hypothetical protein
MPPPAPAQAAAPAASAPARAVAARRQALLADALVFAVVLLAYAPAFTSDYAFSDEYIFVGLDPSRPDLQPLASARFFAQQSGRWLGGLFVTLPFLFAGGDPWRIRIVRLVTVTLLALAAVVTRRLLDRSLRAPWWTALLALAIFAQRAVAAHAGQSVVMFGQALAFVVALAAFALAVPRDGDPGVAPWPRLAGAFACLLMGMQIHQGVAFLGLVPLVAVILAEWPRRGRQAASLLVLMVLVLGISVLAYRWNIDALHAASSRGYQTGEAAIALTRSPVAALRVALDPRHYWPAFRLWAFPFPLERVRNLDRVVLRLAWAIMLAWAALVATAAVIDARRRSPGPAALAAQWASVLVALGLAVFPILADAPAKIPGPWIRPHIALVASGVVLAIAGWALGVIAVGRSAPARRLLAAAAVALVVFWCAGARSGLRRGIVEIGVAQVSFVRSALAGHGEVSRILVVLPERNGCPTEPCDLWNGVLAPYELHARQQGFYLWALRLERGTSQAKPAVEFTRTLPEPPLPDGTLVVDWNEGTRREALRRGLGWQGLGRIRVNPTPVPSPTGRETAPSPSSRHPAAAPAAANASAT